MKKCHQLQISGFPVCLLVFFALYLALEPSLYGTIRRTRIHKVICKSMYWNKFNIKFYKRNVETFSWYRKMWLHRIKVQIRVLKMWNAWNFMCLLSISLLIFVPFFSFAFIYSFYLNSFLMPIYVVFSSYRFMNDVIMYLFILNITLYVSEITIL